MKRKWKVMMGILIVAVVLAFVYLENNKDLEAKILEVQPGTIAKTFKEEGKVVPEVEQPLFALYPGVIIDLAVEEGQQVNKGQRLAVLDAKELDYQIRQLQAQLLSLQGEEANTFREPYQAAVRSQEWQVEQARRHLEAAETDFKRMERLFEAGAVTRKDFETAVEMLETAKINLQLQKEALSLLYESHSPLGGTEQLFAGRTEAIKAQMEMLQYQRNKHTIVAPIDGTVANLLVKKGAMVGPQVPMMNIFQTDAYVVEVYVLTADLPSIQKDMEVALIQDRKDGEVVFTGTVKKIAPAAVETISALGLKEQRVKVTIQPQTPEKPALFPGYKLEVEFTLDQRDNVLVVPKTALFPYEADEALWVVREGKAVVQPVTTGFEHNRDVVVVSGLQAGDLVILNPQLEGLKEGKNVAVSR